MGQYYKAVNIDKMECVSPWSYDNGAKLMEHSWLKNNFLRAVESLLVEGGSWHKDRIVWAGDYMDEGLFIDDDTMNLYQYVEKEIEPKEPKGSFPRYILNHSKRKYVDKEKCPNNDGWIIHPLSLLVSSGNGRGGGDYDYHARRSTLEWVGLWAGDSISIEDSIPDGFMEIIPGFIERPDEE